MGSERKKRTHEEKWEKERKVKERTGGSTPDPNCVVKNSRACAEADSVSTEVYVDALCAWGRNSKMRGIHEVEE
jgi:hypothetical protein